MASLYDTDPAPIQRPDPVAAATAFARRHFPACTLALLAGSVAHGQGRAASDLDIVVLAPHEEPRWATFTEEGWPIEVFVDSPATYRATFARNKARRWPLLPTLCVEGLVLIDGDGLAPTVREDARRLLDAGPDPLSDEEIAAQRHFLTVAFDDFADADDPDEQRLLGHELATTAASCYLVARGHWRGLGKWLLRDLRRADPTMPAELTRALDALYRDGQKGPLLAFAASVLDLVGGRRFEGYGETW